MAEHTQQDGDVPNNGHRPPDEDIADLRASLVNSWTHRELITKTITQLSKSPYKATMLYEPLFQQRFAEVRRENPPLYFGELLQAVSISLRERATAWDRDIEHLALALDELDIVALSTVEPEDIHWLWYPYIPRKKLTLFEGDPASGKTYLLLSIAAAITRGYSLPDQKGKVGTPSDEQKGNVLYITAEDGIADTIRPRADKVNADLERLFVPRDPQVFSLQEPQRLSNAMARFQPQLLVLDPITAFLGAEMDMHRANEVRPLMTTLLALAIKHNCAVVAVRHWTKAPGGKAKHRGQGNADFTAAARSVLSIGESPEDERYRIMAQAKASLAALGNAMVFQITDEGMQWCGTSTITADELSAAQPKRQKTQRKNAMEWLRDFLRDGPHAATDVAEAADAVGITDKQLRTAREHLGVLATKEGKTWFWRLPHFQKWDRFAGRDEDEDEDGPPY